MDGQIDLAMLLDMKMLESFLRDFATVTGITSCAMTSDREYLVENTPPYNRLCFDIIRSTEEGRRRCIDADLALMAQVKEAKRYGIHICHNGLVDMAAPIIVEGKDIGYVVGGQVLSKPPDEEWHRKNALELGLDPDEYLKALSEITIISMEKIEASAHLMEGVGNAIANATYQRLLQERKVEEMAIIVRELSTPVIPLWDRILALPLIGSIDTGRAQLIMENLLDGITRHRATEVIIDITGVPAIDTRVAQHLLQTVEAARLLGAECIITGIRPEVAQTMVSLGIDLSGISTRRDLQNGISYALHNLGLSIGPVRQI